MENRKKSQNSACAFGYGDLYDEWIKQNERKKISISVKADQPVSSSDALKGLEPEQKQPLK